MRRFNTFIAALLLTAPLTPTYRASVSTTGSTYQLVGCDGSGWTYH
jgi:hypothetical protein